MESRYSHLLLLSDQQPLIDNVFKRTGERIRNETLVHMWPPDAKLPVIRGFFLNLDEAAPSYNSSSLVTPGMIIIWA